MLSKECKECKYCFWVVALGQGVRCHHPKNQIYRPVDQNPELPVIVSYIPDGCIYIKKKDNK